MLWWDKTGKESLLPQRRERVRIAVADDGAYASYVHEVGLRRLFLAGGEPLPPLPARAPVTISYARTDALYQFTTQVVGPSKGGLLAVARPHQVSRVQHRRYYRLLLESPTTLRLLGHGDLRSNERFPVRLINLSGGGALLASSKPIMDGLVVAVRVPAGREGDARDIEAEVLECRVAERGTARVYLLRLRFFEPPRLPVEDREAIIAYLYEQQRVLLRNRKLLRV